jgi:sterol desaturase/sphingolipid hydroxylase (fatty acid hydroxylase superfamily)
MDLSPFARILPILGLLAFVSASELVIPLRTQPRNPYGRLKTNLLLTLVTLLLGVIFNGALLAGAAYLNAIGFGLFPVLDLHGIAALLVALVVLDFSAYSVHVLMHKTAWAWRLHLIHHIDLSVDATTALRQHPLEGLLRFCFAAGAAWSLGATPEAIAIYRLFSSANAILEHANVCLPRWLDRILVWVWVTPNMHKMHHSRSPDETNSNYSNLFSFFDRLFGTFKSSDRAPFVVYGIDRKDILETQSIIDLIRMPFRRTD